MSKALDEYLGIPHSDRESCALDAAAQDVDRFKQEKGEVVYYQRLAQLERIQTGTYHDYPMRYRDFKNILPTLRKWETTADVTPELRQKFRQLNDRIAAWLKAHADEKR